MVVYYSIFKSIPARVLLSVTQGILYTMKHPACSLALFPRIDYNERGSQFIAW